MTTTKRQAKKGGEYGANGDFYQGGQFINTVEQNPKGSGSSRPFNARKKQVAPYTWIMEPSEGLRSIFTYLNGTVTRINEDDEMYVVTGLGDSPEWLVINFGSTVERIAELVKMYNAGERWVSFSEDAA